MNTLLRIAAVGMLSFCFGAQLQAQGLVCSSHAYLGAFDPISNEARSVSVSGTLCALADAGAVRLLDIGNPLEPMELGSYLDASFPYDVQLEGNLVYVAAFFQGLAAPKAGGVGTSKRPEQKPNGFAELVAAITPRTPGSRRLSSSMYTSPPRILKAPTGV